MASTSQTTALSMAYDDDDRSLKGPVYTSMPLVKEEEYVPIWKILKEMYDEDKEALYCQSTNQWQNSWDGLSLDGYDSDTVESVHEDDDSYSCSGGSTDFSDNEAEENRIYKNVYYK